MSESVHILCFGNPLHGDDGFGPAVAAALRKAVLPAGAKVYEVGTRGLDALALFNACDRVILVDAMLGEEAGRLSLIDPESVVMGATPSLHGAGLANLLGLMNEIMPLPPEVQMLVAQVRPPQPYCLQLSPQVASLVPRAAAWILRNLAMSRRGWDDMAADQEPICHA